MDWSDLIKNKPAVRTMPPTAQETLSLNGITLTHRWISSNSPTISALWGTSECEPLHESEMESRLALPPQQDVSSGLMCISSDGLTAKPAARQSSVPLDTHSEALPQTKSFTPHGARTQQVNFNQNLFFFFQHSQGEKFSANFYVTNFH